MCLSVRWLLNHLTSGSIRQGLSFRASNVGQQMAASAKSCTHYSWRVYIGRATSTSTKGRRHQPSLKCFGQVTSDNVQLYCQGDIGRGLPHQSVAYAHNSPVISLGLPASPLAFTQPPVDGRCVPPSLDIACTLLSQHWLWPTRIFRR